MKSLRTALAAALLASPFAAAAHHDGDVVQLSQIAVSHAWTEETGDMAHGVDVFLTIANEGEAPVRLIAADTGFTEPGVFQTPVVAEDGALAIREVPAIEIAPGQTITFQPGGLRISLGNAQRVHDAGDHFHMTLEFEGAGEMEIDVEVERRDDARTAEEPAT